jgi:chromosome segregation ATPase
MPDKIAEGAAALYAVGGSVLTVLLRALVDRGKAKDRLSTDARLKTQELHSDQEEREIKRVWARVERLEQEKDALHKRLDDCQDGHRICESKYEALLVRFELVERRVGLAPAKPAEGDEE